MTSPSSEWVPILYVGDSDPADDQQTSTGGGEADIVGNATTAALFKRYDPVDDQIAFRLRLGGDDNPAGYTSATLIAFDIGGDGILDGYLGVEENAIGPGNTKHDIGIFLFSGTADTPNNTQSVLASPSAPEYSYEQSGSNYNWSSVESIDGDDDANPSSPVDVDGFGSDDYFLTFSVPFSDLADALNIDSGTVLGFVAITSQNLQQINNDFNGIDNNDPNFNPDAPWNDPDQPIVSQPYTPESESPIPEPAAFALLLGLAAGICLLRRPQR